MEHLTELDDMRRGIGLRGYAQQDPLNEFRREAFSLYEELREFIRHQVASTIFRVTVVRQPAEQPVGVPSGGAAAGTSTGAAGSGSVVRTSTSTGRAGGPDAATSANLAAGIAAARALAGGTGSATGGQAPAAKGLPNAPAAMRRMQESLGDQPIAGGPSSGLRDGYTPRGQRIGRNDPCWCGSGLKYKKCHGR